MPIDIGHRISNLFFHRSSQGPGVAADGPRLIRAHLEDTVTPLQVSRLDRGLRAIRALPGGDTLLRALSAHSEATGNLPRIVMDDSAAGPPIATLDVSDGTWRVNPLALETYPDSGLQALARLYEDLARPRWGKFYSVSPDRLPQADAQLQARWDKWREEGLDMERRDHAVALLKTWVTETRYYGGLDYLGIVHLLDLIASGERPPENLDAELDLSGLSLRELPKMPPGVRVLRADHNWLASLKHLPRDLRVLRMNYALLSGDSRNLIHQLLRLPSSLVVLELDGNFISNVFQLLHIEQWRLPSGLKTLSLRVNALQALPPLPPGLTTLRASDNCLGHISAGTLKRASNLREADLSDNFLANVPASLAQLHPACQVNLSGNPMHMVIANLSRSNNIPDDLARQRLPEVLSRRPGPRIVYKTSSAKSRINAPTLLEISVKHWLGDQMAKAAAQWRDIANEEGALEFALLLAYLAKSASANAPGFKASMGEWLTELAQPRRAALRRSTFAACVGASAHCVDRAAWTLTQLTMLRVNDDIEQGVYDTKPHELLELGRQLFRLRELTKISIAKSDELFKKIKNPENREDIEVHLGYQTMLRKDLNLTLVVPEMNYPRSSSLRGKDLVRAKQEIQQREATDFHHFLCVEWQGWRTMLERNCPQAYKAAQESLHKEEETRFDDLLSQALREERIDPDNQDARVAKGPEVQRKMEYAILAPVTRDYLASVGVEAQALPHLTMPRQAPAGPGPWPGSFA